MHTHNFIYFCPTLYIRKIYTILDGGKYCGENKAEKENMVGERVATLNRMVRAGVTDYGGVLTYEQKLEGETPALHITRRRSKHKSPKQDLCVFKEQQGGRYGYS